MLKNLIITSLLLFGSVLGATYVYEDNQDLYDLRNYSGTTNLNVGDDQVSAKFNFGFDFTYYDSLEYWLQWDCIVLTNSRLF